nr:sigma-70 family RNA polymerase sigma factor [Clostridia bacterium]
MDNITALTEELINNHMEKLFYFSLKKTGDSHEAEDLTSDILLSVLTTLKHGIIPDNLGAYVRKIARNRYSVWAAKKHRRAEHTELSDITELELCSDEADPVESLIQSEDAALLRRELAFISSDYRKIIVAYYLENRRTAEIAKSLGLPKGTLESKLHRARQKLKEGMNMAREFGKRSYNPENVNFVNNGLSFGKHGQPWTILSHLLYKNIFLQAYNNPSTAEELALELGIALPY